MQTSPQILAASNLNPKDKRVVVVEGVDPYEVQKLLPDVLIFVQGTSEDFGDTIFSSEDGVLNVLKPNIFVSDDPTPEDIKLCASFGCNVSTLQHLTEELAILEYPKNIKIIKDHLNSIKNDNPEEHHDFLNSISEFEVSSKLLQQEIDEITKEQHVETI